MKYCSVGDGEFRIQMIISDEILFSWWWAMNQCSMNTILQFSTTYGQWVANKLIRTFIDKSKTWTVSIHIEKRPRTKGI